MTRRVLHGIMTVSTGVLCSLAVVATARAELVSYDFTASVTRVDSWEARAAGLQVKAEDSISGSFSYDSSRGWWGTSSSWSDPSLQLTLDQLPRSASFFTLLEYNGQGLSMQSIGRTGRSYYAASLELSGPSLAPYNHYGLPTSLTLGAGTLTLYLNTNDFSPDLVASLTSLTRSGPSGGAGTPEFDPGSGAGALVLLLGGLGIVLSRRRRH